MRNSIFFTILISVLISSCTQKNVNSDIFDEPQATESSSSSNANFERFSGALVNSLPLIENALEEETLRASSEDNEDLYKVALMELAKESKEFLLNEGLENDDIEEIFKGNDAHVILGALVIFDNYRINNTPTRANVLDCLGRALLGFDVADFAVRKSLSSVAAKRMALKFATSAAIKAGLGFAGAALTAATFTTCMLE